MNTLNGPVYRDTENGKIAGVCAGLARALGVDPIYVRIAAVILAAFDGAGIIAYIIAWVLLKPAPSDQPDDRVDEVAKDSEPTGENGAVPVDTSSSV